MSDLSHGFKRAFERRSASLERAAQSVALDGFELPPQVREVNDAFARGEITRQEHIDTLRRLCGAATQD